MRTKATLVSRLEDIVATRRSSSTSQAQSGVREIADSLPSFLIRFQHPNIASTSCEEQAGHVGDKHLGGASL